MGGALSNPIDADTEAKMKEIIKDTVETFAANYPIAYKNALFEKIKADLLAESGESSYQLSSRGPVSESEAASAEPLMTGWLTKEGAIRKSWKKRFFVVRQDYKTDYYADEDAYKNKKEPKGTISPAGCKVVENPENELADRLKATAAKLKVDVSELGKPKSFPPNTFGIMHDTRRSWYITAESPDDMKKWIKMFQFCAQRASGLNNQEEVAKAAYESAFETTLNKAGYSDTWNFNGTEEENLTDLITRKLRTEVLDGVFDKIEGPVKIKSMISEKVEQGVDSAVGTSVNASWSAVSKGVNATRPTLESTLKQSIKPVIEEQNKVTDEVKSKVNGIVDPAIAKHVAPKVAKVLTPLQGPVVKCFTELISVWSKSVDESVGSLEKGSSESAVFSKLDILPALSSTIETVYKSIDAAAEHLTTLGDDIPALKEVDTVAGLLGNIKDGAASILDNAVFTFEKTFKEEKNGASAKAKTLAKLNHDASQKVEDSLVSFIAGLASPAVEADVVEPCKELVAPLQDSIPDVAKDFVNIDKVLSNVIDGSIEEAIKTTVKPSVPKFE